MREERSWRRCIFFLDLIAFFASRRIASVHTETHSGGTTTSRRSVTVRSGSVARVTSTGSGKVSCRIVLNGRTVASKTGTGSVTCASTVTR